MGQRRVKGNSRNKEMVEKALVLRGRDRYSRTSGFKEDKDLS